jgi:hypothetical protein
MGVRWDAVVECEPDRFEARSGPASAALPTLPASASVDIWLFGSLAEAVAERPLTLEFRNPFSIDDVIAELGRRYGDAFLSLVTSPDGGMLRHCRVFVNGEDVEDTGAPVCAQEPLSQIEMILLTAAEGG